MCLERATASVSAYHECVVTSCQQLDHDVADLCLQRKDAKHFVGTPGQFVMVRHSAHTTAVGRPISIAEITNDGQLRLLVRQVGAITQLLFDAKINDVWQVMGPLGQGFALPATNVRCAIVGGGIGIAPLLELAKQLTKTTGAKPVAFLGYRTEPFGLEMFEPYVARLCATTETGSSCHPGLVTELISMADYDYVFACGPEAMLKALTRTRPAGVNLQLSLERKMACGFGVCLGCVVSSAQGGKKRVCADGPVFSADEVFL